MKRNYSLPNNKFNIVTIDEGYAHLACSIVEQAVWDWRKMVDLVENMNGVYPTYVSLWDIITFFNSWWFEMLTSAINITPNMIRENLYVPPRLSGIVIRLSGI